MIYLDHAATTPMNSSALETLLSSSKEEFANPNSAHKLGKELNKKLQKIKADILKDFPDFELIFTSGATESNNMLIKGLDIKEVCFDPSDHPSITKVCETLKHTHELTDQTELLVLSHVNNLNGKINLDPQYLNKIKRKNLHIHIDGAQAFGKLSIPKCSFDSYSFSSHKMGGPKGIGGLLIRNSIKCRPLILGGGQQEGMRSGTVAFPLINSFYEAYKNARLDKEIQFKEIIKSELSSFMSFPFEKEETSPYILLGLVEGISSDILLRYLESRDIYISSSSACSSKVKGFSPTFAAMGIEEKFHKNILRISFGASTTESEVREFVNNFKEILDDISHLTRKK